MKLIQIAMLSAVLVSAPAFANKELATKNACMACHAVDKKLLGPAYQDVAKKYAGQKDAEANLIAGPLASRTTTCRRWWTRPGPRVRRLSWS